MNWKKMAEAFGELAGRNMQKGKTSNVDAWSRNTANKSADMKKAYSEGESLGSDLQKIADEIEAASNRGETRKPMTSDETYDQLKEVNQSNKGPGQSLEKDFEEAFDDIAEERGYKKWREGAKDSPLDDGMGGQIHDIEREGAVDDARQEMIDDLLKGMPIEDVLEKYRPR